MVRRVAPPLGTCEVRPHPTAAIVLDAERVLKKLKVVAPDLVERQQTIVALAQQAAGLKRRSSRD